MSGYNLFDGQKELLRDLVELMEEGELTKSFVVISNPDPKKHNAFINYIPLERGDSHQFTDIADLDALCDASPDLPPLMTWSWNTQGTTKIYRINRAALDAIDSDFEAPDTSFSRHLTPLADITNLDDEIKDRCLPVLGAGGADPKMWDSAVRTAMVILEERLRDVGRIANVSRIGRDLVNDVFGKDGTLAGKFSQKSEREGYRDLHAGVVGVLRNPYAHRLKDPSPEDGGAMLVFVDLLLRMLEDLR